MSLRGSETTKQSKFLVLATRNQNKIKEIKALFGNGDFEIRSLLDFPDIPQVEEAGATFSDNATAKARETAKRTGIISMADDSGLEVYALDGRPGVRSARFSGEKVNYDSNNRKLLKLMSNLPAEKRGACFRCVIAVAWPDGKVKTVEGRCEGEIAFEPRGKNGFGYDPVFLDPVSGKTFAELSFEEKNRISHRAKAVLKARGILGGKNG